MKELDEMHIADIIDITNLYLDANSLFEIWKDETPDIPESMSAHKMLLKDRKLAQKIINDQFELYTFLINHDKEIDRFKFLTTLLINYKETLSMAGGIKITPNDFKEMKR